MYGPQFTAKELIRQGYPAPHAEAFPGRQRTAAARRAHKANAARRRAESALALATFEDSEKATDA